MTEARRRYPGRGVFTVASAGGVCLLVAFSCSVDDRNRVYGRDIDSSLGAGEAGEAGAGSGETGGAAAGGIIGRGGTPGSGAAPGSGSGGMVGPGGASGGEAGGEGPDEPGPSSGGGGAAGEPEPSTLGAPCTAAEECASGYCVDGVCCDGACDEVCAACDGGEPGTCAGVAVDPGCGELACPESSECRSYEPIGDGANCEGIGACRTEPACDVVDANADVPCASGEGTCDGAGECVVAGKLSLGEVCDAGDECGSGFCAETSDGERVCCDAACDGNCQACGDDGRCDQSLTDDAGCGVVRCPGDSTCRDYPTSVTQNRCVAGTCGTGEQVCSFTAQGEGQSCASTLLCDASGGCSVPKSPLGAVCGEDVECAGGQCVDGVCCESACDGPCMNCRAGTGKCDVMPPDDEVCEDVVCGLSGECVTGTVPTTITTNLCKSLGQCKSKADCGGTPYKARGTACGRTSGPAQICDGEGVCRDPGVSCGSTADCSVNTEVNCCYYSVSSSSNPASKNCSTSECRSTGDGWSRTPMYCDEHEDCPTGRVCCLTVAPGGSEASCRLPADCNLKVTGTSTSVSYYELCQSPKVTRACSKGTCGYEWTPHLAGFKFCNGW